MKSKATVKPSYSLRQNLRFVLGNIWRRDRPLIWYGLIRIPTASLIPFCTLLLPKITLDCLEQQVSVEEMFWRICGIIAVISLVGILYQYCRSRAYPARSLSGTRYTADLVGKHVDTDYSNIESSEGQTLWRRAINAIYSDYTGIIQFQRVLIDLLENAAGFLLYAGVLATLHPLIPVLLIATSLAGYAAMRAANRYEYVHRNERAALDKKIFYLIDKGSDYKAAKDIRAYRMTDWFGRLFGSFMKERVACERKVEARGFRADLVNAGMAILRDALAYAYLIWQVIEGNISVGDFTLFFGTIAGFSTWLIGMCNRAAQLVRASNEVCDLRNFLDLQDQSNRDSGIPLPAESELPIDIVFDHVSFHYPGSEMDVLHDVNLHIHPGEKLALVGVNGAGKTTCVKLLCGLYYPTRGRILINGKDTREYNRDEYFTLFSAVFQEVNPIPESVEQNISLLPHEQTDSGRVEHCLRQAGLWKKIESLPDGLQSMMVREVYEEAVQFSGGELQKLLLARALYKSAPIMVLDEPTAALDPIAENQLYLSYSEMIAGRTSLYISHRLSSTRFCDRIVFLKDGRLAEMGSHDELMLLGGEYAAMFEIQSHYYRENPETLHTPEGGGTE